MTTLDLDQEQFCICCNLWGPAETMLPLYRFRDQEAKPCLWLHHHCAETCGNVQFEAGMKRFESQVHTVAQSQAGDAEEAIAKAHAQAQLAKPQIEPPSRYKRSNAQRRLWVEELTMARKHRELHEGT
jgi:hypothetical protein